MLNAHCTIHSALHKNASCSPSCCPRRSLCSTASMLNFVMSGKRKKLNLPLELPLESTQLETIPVELWFEIGNFLSVTELYLLQSHPISKKIKFRGILPTFSESAWKNQVFEDDNVLALKWWVRGRNIDDGCYSLFATWLVQHEMKSIVAGSLKIFQFLEKCNQLWASSGKSIQEQMAEMEYIKGKKSDYCTLAAKNNQLQVLKYLVAQKYSMSSSASTWAVCHRNLKMLQFLQEQNCPLDEKLCQWAIHNWDFDTVKWITTAGCFINKTTSTLSLSKWKEDSAHLKLAPTNVELRANYLRSLQILELFTQSSTIEWQDGKLFNIAKGVCATLSPLLQKSKIKI